MSFFFNDTATTEIYTLSLHDALPIYRAGAPARPPRPGPRRLGAAEDHVPGGRRPRAAAEPADGGPRPVAGARRDRKSTRLNSSHANISYAVFCLKKKKKRTKTTKYIM